MIFRLNIEFGSPWLKKAAWLWIILISLLVVMPAYAKPEASVKSSAVREENPKGVKEVLVLPYIFATDSLGATVGVGGGMKGYGQDQLLVGATVFASSDDAVAGALGVWDFLVPGFDRLFFTFVGSAGHYPRSRAYSSVAYEPGIPPAGSNDSDKNDYVEASGWDNWTDFKLEYTLPLGAAKNKGLVDYHLKHGMLVSPPSGGKTWNPLTSGVSVLMLRQFNRYLTFEEDVGEIEGAVHPLQLGVLYDNTDFPANPSFGSSQYLAVTHDFAWLESDQTWTFLEAEASKYFSLGPSKLARQRVAAFNFWTGSAPTWEAETLDNGYFKINHRPPYFEGARLGGFYRMRAYPSNRFNDRSVIYTSAEYRYTPEWNPLGSVAWLRFLAMDWWQFVAFIEGGRVANTYSVAELTQDWKLDVGGSVRAMVSGGIIRVCAAFSAEGSSVWVMVGHPF